MFLCLLRHKWQGNRRDSLAGRDLGLDVDLLEMVGERHCVRLRVYMVLLT